MQCPVSVYTQEGKTYISTLRPMMISDFYPQADITTLAAEVDKIVLNIVNEAR